MDEDFAFLVFRYGFFVYSIVTLFSLGFNKILFLFLVLSLGISAIVWGIYLELRERVIQNQNPNYYQKDNYHQNMKGAEKR